MLAATTQIQSDHSLCPNMNSTLFWVALRVGHGDLVPGFAWSLAGCFLALGWSAPSLLPCCIGQFGPCWGVQSAYRGFTELILEKQKVFGTTAQSDLNTDYKSCQRGEDLKKEIKNFELWKFKCQISCLLTFCH